MFMLNYVGHTTNEKFNTNNIGDNNVDACITLRNFLVVVCGIRYQIGMILL